MSSHRSWTLALCCSMTLLGEETAQRWLSLHGELRGRFEAPSALRFERGNNDFYYFDRLRLSATLRARSWLSFVVEGQDSRAPGYDAPVPGNVEESFDLRQFYAELGTVGGQGWALRTGRQAFKFGDGRLVADPNWGNVGRVFDAVRLSYARPGMKLDWFASSVVTPVDHRFDRSDTGNMFYGFYSSLDWNRGNAHTEPYFFWKSNALVKGISGRWGHQDIQTLGARNFGKLSRRLDYEVEMALQSGHAAGDNVRAWAAHAWLGYKLWSGDRAPRLVGSHSYASGDQDPRDGLTSTFDTLYPSSHNRVGQADRIGWRNIHDTAGGVEWVAGKKWKLGAKWHTIWLATVQDALYNGSGSVVVRNSKAVSSHVGEELDFSADYKLSKRLLVSFGYAHLFRGPFLRESGFTGGASHPYLMWAYAF